MTPTDIVARLREDGNLPLAGRAWIKEASDEIERLCARIAELEAIANTDTPELEMQHAEIMQLRKRITELEAEVERLRLWIRRIDNINDDPAHFSKEIDQACIDAFAGKPMAGLINAKEPRG